MNNPIEKPLPVIDLKNGDLIVDVDWSSTGLWVCVGTHNANVDYVDYELPDWLIGRFDYWTAWFNMNDPQHIGETLDFNLFNAYGRALAVDVKRLVGKEQRVFYGFHADNERHCSVSSEEIVLPDEERLRITILPD